MGIWWLIVAQSHLVASLLDATRVTVMHVLCAVTWRIITRSVPLQQLQQDLRQAFLILTLAFPIPLDQTSVQRSRVHIYSKLVQSVLFLKMDLLLRCQDLSQTFPPVNRNVQQCGLRDIILLSKLWLTTFVAQYLYEAVVVANVCLFCCKSVKLTNNITNISEIFLWLIYWVLMWTYLIKLLKWYLDWMMKLYKKMLIKH